MNMTSRNKIISLLAGASALAMLGVTAVNSQIVTGTQDFSITVEEGVDTTPDSFAMGGFNAPVLSEVTLGPIPLSGFNEEVAISVSGGGSPEYSLDGGATYNSAAGTVNAGDQVYLRASASASADQDLVVSLAVGDVTETFTISTTAAHPEQFVSVFNGPTSSPSWQFITADISDHVGKTGRFLARYDRTGSFRGDIQFDDVTVGTQFWDLSLQSVATQWERKFGTGGVEDYADVSWTNVSSGTSNSLWNYKSSRGTGSSGTGVSTGFTGNGQIYYEAGGSGNGRTWLRSPETSIESGDFSFALGALGTGLGTLDVFLYLPEVGTPLTPNYPVSVETVDDTPDAFVVSSSSDPSAVEPGDLFTFDPVTVAGMDAGVTVSASVFGGGSPEFRINGGAWVTSGTVENGDTIQVRLNASSGFLIEQVATLSVSSVNTTFSVTTRAPDSLPDAFVFAGLTGQEPSTTVTSAPVTPTGFEEAVLAPQSGLRVSVNGGSFTGSEQTIQAGQSISLRMTLGQPSEVKSLDLFVRDLSGNTVLTVPWSVTTRDPVGPSNPNFAWTYQTCATSTGCTSTSETITLSGSFSNARVLFGDVDTVKSTPSSSRAGWSGTNMDWPSVSINGGAFLDRYDLQTTSRTVNPGDTLRIQFKSGSRFVYNLGASLNVGETSLWRCWSKATYVNPDPRPVGGRSTSSCQ